MENLHITHVHGSLGPLETVNGSGRAYGPISNPAAYRAAAESVWTCYEEASSDATLVARKLISESDEVVVLGFGYSKENLARLALGDSIRPPPAFAVRYMSAQASRRRWANTSG